MIPPVIHQIWWQGLPRVPRRYLQFRAGWMRHHPQWQFEFWDEARSRALIHDRYRAYRDLFDGYRLEIQRMDAIRYFILHAHGGVYLDLDMECRKPIDDLILDKTFLLSKTLIYNNAVIGSSAAHPFWPRLFESLQRNRHPEELWARSRSRYAAESCGPGLLNNTVRAEGLPLQQGVQICPGFCFEPGVPAEWEGKITRSGDRSRSYAVHHMDMGWLPPLHRVSSQLSAQVLKLYWLARRG